MSTNYEKSVSFADFKARNIDRLSAAFYKLYGHQIHEAADFFQAEYERHVLAHTPEEQPPATRSKKRSL